MRSRGESSEQMSFSPMGSDANPLEALYREVILQHYQHPRNKGRMEDAAATIRLTNPSCGDRIELFLKTSPDGRVEGITYEGQGCSISQASASMMTQAVRGKSLQEALELVERFKRMVRGELPASEADLGDLEALQGVAKFPVRVKCATLSWEALRRGLESDEGRVSGEVE